MAVRISRTTGAWLTAGTWGLVDSTSYNNSESATTALTTSYQTSTTFTPGTITVDGIAVKLSVRTGTTGTMSVALDQAGGTVSGTEVTINTADLPVAATADLNGGWIFFKFASPVALSAATAYGVKAKTSSSSQVSLFSSATTNWSRALSTTTTGAPAAGDDIIVCGEYTGAGTSNTFTVTMDALASSITDYGAGSTSLVTPALAVCSKGILSYGTTAATNYYLRLSGNGVVYTNGIFNIGTTGTPIPRDSSAVLNFDCGANVDFGLKVRNLGTCNAQGLSRTVSKEIYYCKLNTDEATNSTSLGVDTDTGWLDNDEIVVATTTRTANQTEKGTLNGAAGASTLTVDGFAGAGGGLAAAHSGTSPTQAEVILLTRNVQIFGASASLQSFIDIDATATVDFDWAEMKWLGSNTANKRGVNIATTTGSCSFQYCSRHTSTVANSVGWFINSASGSNITVSNSVSFNTAGGAFSNAATTGTQIVENNLFMYCTDNIQLVTLGDVGTTFTNNVMVGANANASWLLNELGGTIGTMSNNTVHGTLSSALQINNAIFGTISNTTIWRNNSTGLILPNGGEITFNGITLFGNGSQNIYVQNGGIFKFISAVVNGESATYTTTTGLNFATGTGAVIYFYNSSFGVAGVGNISTHQTADIVMAILNNPQVYLNNTTLASTEVSGQATMSPSSFISSQKHDGSSTTHKTLKRYGTLAYETTTVHTGSQSLKMTPINASFKLESGSFLVAVASGATVTPTVYVYEDGSYNGARARLILKRNDAIGITSDVVIDTATSSSDAAWEGLTGTTASATDDGVMEFVIDCDGTAGNLFVDSFSVA